MVEITEPALSERADEFVARAERGECFTILVDGRAVAQLLPLAGSTSATVEE